MSSRKNLLTICLTIYTVEYKSKISHAKNISSRNVVDHIINEVGNTMTNFPRGRKHT